MRLLRRLFPTRFGSTGERGEAVAARWLKRRGYTIVQRNRRVVDDEADIVAVTPDNRMLVIVEVKTRCRADALPELAVNGTKQGRLARLAARLSRDRRLGNRPIRFDVVAVIWPVGQPPVVRHHPGAFDSPW